MRVFIDYKKKSYEFDVKESMTVGELKDMAAATCPITHLPMTRRSSPSRTSSYENNYRGEAAAAIC